MNKSDRLAVIPSDPNLSARLATLLTALLATSIFTPIIWRMAGSAYDYIVHTDFAVKMLASRTLPSPHFLLQSSIIALQQLLPISFKTASALVVLLAIAGTAALLFRMIRSACQPLWFAGALTICLMLIAPIPLFALFDGKYYFGYIATNVYHNPTILLLKPFALLVFVTVFSQRGEEGDSGWKSLGVGILATIACALAKPSYIIVIVPALVAAILFPVLRESLAKRMGFITMGILLPALVILAVQYWLTYSSEQITGVYQGESRIIFAPLMVMSAASSGVAVKFLLSIAFPLSVFIGYFRQARVHPRLLFAWLSFMFGAVYTYLFAESGPRMYQGNFLWSGQITLFILFVVSAGFLCEQVHGNGIGDRYRKLIFIVCTILFILHTLSGINLYMEQYAIGDYGQ